MRVLVLNPGANFSVTDVARGWTRALERLTPTLALNLEDRLFVAANSRLPYQGDDTDLRLAWDWQGAVRHVQDQILAAVWRAKPDIVLVVSGFFVHPDTLDLIRERAKTVLLCTESPYQDDQQLEWAQHYDVTLLNDPTNIEQFAAVCPLVRYVPHSYDPTVHYPGPPVHDYLSDCVIVGTGYPSRIAFLEQVDWTGVDLALLGNWTGLADHPLRRYLRQPVERQGCDNDLAIDYYRSTRASLNLYRTEADSPELSAGWSMGPREVELAACGTFFLTGERGENREVLPFVPLIGTPDEVSDDLRWWLAHERERDKVVLKARETLAGWTFENRARSLMGLLES